MLILDYEKTDVQVLGFITFLTSLPLFYISKFVFLCLWTFFSNAVHLLRIKVVGAKFLDVMDTPIVNTYLNQKGKHWKWIGRLVCAVTYCDRIRKCGDNSTWNRGSWKATEKKIKSKRHWCNKSGLPEMWNSGLSWL